MAITSHAAFVTDVGAVHRKAHPRVCVMELYRAVAHCKRQMDADVNEAGYTGRLPVQERRPRTEYVIVPPGLSLW
ncbi:hypothetical protein PAXRUDRAFT_823934 [Paxillus rubicundulus Ve08.2h10]|uniref:Unplaced genomic scaffold scaffold_73, whole genome shotgun sequence n=1 Tax=Paxillus rubicundulus Ve08.2h10 TaxID=930991 RepID=A0A0D0EBX5_9AGAM|nr:hypothetical protein PAXRUDRAFT_823934 [Paxillus rubicundulus Ve08.2h10]